MESRYKFQKFCIWVDFFEVRIFAPGNDAPNQMFAYV